jgi:zinc protease
MKKIIFCFLFVSSFCFASFLKENVEKYQHELGDVVWVKDDKFPRFNITIYFGQGAVLDDQSSYGATQASLDLITAGTKKMNQAAIHEFFDFYGAETSSYVTHEYSQFQFSGLLKDLDPITAKVCELFKEASYPEAEIKNHVNKLKSKLNNLTSNHAALAERTFRYVLMGQTPYKYPAEGKLNSLSKINSKNLQSTLKTLKGSYKRFYLSGPKEIKDSMNLLKNCEFTPGQKIKHTNIVQSKNVPGIYFLKAPNANQVQIRLGRLLTQDESKKEDTLMSVAADYLGGGFTAKLMQELRVKRGLTYSVGAHVSPQASYGRAGISTFTKNETLGETIQLIQTILKDSGDEKKLAKDDVEHVKKYVKGSFPFTFESLSAFLSQLIILDHREVGYDGIEKFVEEVDDIDVKNLSNKIEAIFNPDQLVIVLVGDESVLKQVESLKPVTKLNLADIL